MTSAPETLTIADQALLDAVRTWGPVPTDSRFWECFNPGWKASLTRAIAAAPAAPPTALDRLRRAQQAQSRPDLARIHASWWIRALKDETPAIRRAVSAHAPAAVRDSLLAGLGLHHEDLETDRPADPEALRCVLALWSERLVGDVPERDDDPPVVVALTRLVLDDVSRLIHAAGLVKWALAGEEPPGLRPRDRERLESFRARLGVPGPRLAQLARLDVARHGRSANAEEERLGLVTFARLLDVAEPFRVRWALQHLPYPVARFTRSLMDPKSKRTSSLAAWEGDVLRNAWERLRSEGTLEGDPGEVV